MSHDQPPSTPSRPSHPAAGDPHALPEIDVRERGAPREGVAQVLDRRLFMQLLVFQSAPGRAPAAAARAVFDALVAQDISCVVYDDTNDPHGLGVLTWTENPGDFVTAVRPVLGDPALGLTLRPEFTMLGRTYSTGYEQDLPFWILERPVKTVTTADWPWHVWYPLRRSGDFARLEGREQGAILREHGTIGRAYGAANLAHDIRLACHGLDAKDNEFVIGLVGAELYPLSHVVQSMRKTRQTAEFISQMGPFFVGYARYRHTRRGA